MTKADIVERISERIGFSKRESSLVVELVFETLKETLEKGENVKVSKFGNFVVKRKRARKGRNPQTGEDITITSRKVLVFKASQLLKTAINSG